MEPIKNQPYTHYNENNPRPATTYSKEFMDAWQKAKADAEYRQGVDEAQKAADQAGHAGWFNEYWAAPKTARILFRRDAPNKYDKEEVIHLDGINGDRTYNNMVITPLKERVDTSYYDLNNSYDPAYINMLKGKYEQAIMKPTTVGATPEDHAYLQKERARVQGLKRVK